MAIAAIINVVDFYIENPDVLRQLKAADPKNPALEAYIYEALRKAILTSPWRCVLMILDVCRYRSSVPWCLS